MPSDKLPDEPMMDVVEEKENLTQVIENPIDEVKFVLFSPPIFELYLCEVVRTI